MTSLSYPSGRVVNQMYDPMGRLTQMLAAGQPPYLSVASGDYSAAGQVKHALYGNGVAGDFTYNERLQLSSLRYSKPGSPDLLNLGYEYGTQNNGQIQKVRYYTAPGVEDLTKTQSYEYDAWSHLKRAYTTDLTQPGTWRLEWGYDRLGNRRNQSLTGGNTAITQPQLTISETTNRITTAGFAYDAAGNMTNDSLHTYTYDAENRMTKVDNGTTATYSYVGASRVKKVAGSTTTVYIFSGSKVIAEYVNGALSKEYVYSGSSLLATLNPDGSVASYEHPDHLSTRVETDAAGLVTRTFGQYPFGEVWYETGTANKWKFTSYERDGESGLDYAISRYDSSRLGRFLSPDPLAGSLRNPQSLNRYSYVGNDPINGVDPLGLKRRGLEGGGELGRDNLVVLTGGPGRSNCTMDGVDTPCSMVYAALRSGGAVQCPNNVCSGVTSDGRPVQFRAPTVGPGAYYGWVFHPAERYSFATYDKAGNLLGWTFGVTTSGRGWELIGEVLTFNGGDPAGGGGEAANNGTLPNGDVPIYGLYGHGADILGQVGRTTGQAIHPCTIAAFYGASALIGGGGLLLANAPIILETGLNILQTPGVVADFIQGATPGSVPASSGGYAGYLTKLAVDHYSQIASVCD